MALNQNIRLVAYKANGTKLGIMPQPIEATITIPLNDTPSLQAAWTRTQDINGWITGNMRDGLEIGVEVSDQHNNWFEPVNCRFILLRRETDTTDPNQKIVIKAPGYAWLLHRALQLKVDPASKDPVRTWTEPTPGTIMRDLIEEAKERGTLTGLTFTFTPEKDSNGATWPAKALPTKYNFGTDTWTILDLLASQGRCDWVMRGRELLLYPPEQGGSDLTTENPPVRLDRCRQISEAPQAEILEDTIGRLVITGDNNLRVLINNEQAPSPWGKLETAMSQGGVRDEGMARKLAEADLAKGAQVRGEYTRAFEILPGVPWPLADYSVGDYILAPGHSGQPEKLRVYQITLTLDGDGLHAGVILNDRFADDNIRRARALKALADGASLTGGSGAPTTGRGRDLRIPAAPKNLRAYTDAYFGDGGQPRALLKLFWDEVTESIGVSVVEDELDLDVGGARLTVVVSTHPGDEVLRLGGYMEVCRRRGDLCVLIAVTQGEASGLRGSKTKQVFGAERELEQRKAWAELAGSNNGFWQMSLPDGHVAGNEAAITAKVNEWVDRAAVVEVYCCARVDDPHPDKAAVARAVQASAAKTIRWAYAPNAIGGMTYKPTQPGTVKRAVELMPIAQRTAPTLFQLLEESEYKSYVAATPGGGISQRIDGLGRLTVIVQTVPGEAVRRLGSYIAACAKREDALALVGNVTQQDLYAWAFLTDDRGYADNVAGSALNAKVKQLVQSRVDVEVYVAGDHGSAAGVAAASSGATVVRYGRQWGTATGMKYTPPSGKKTDVKNAWKVFYPDTKKNSTDLAVMKDVENKEFVSWVTR